MQYDVEKQYFLPGGEHAMQYGVEEQYFLAGGDHAMQYGVEEQYFLPGGDHAMQYDVEEHFVCSGGKAMKTWFVIEIDLPWITVQVESGFWTNGFHCSEIIKGSVNETATVDRKN